MGMFLRRGPAPNRTRLSDLEIGQIIKLNVNGKARDWLVVHQGLPSSLYDESCDGTWLLMKDIYEKRAWDDQNYNIYANSTVEAYLSGDFLGLFDSGIQSVIKQVKIPYRDGTGYAGTDRGGANGLSCKIFLLSGPEVGLSGGRDMPNDGTKLDYFIETTSADGKRMAYLNGTAELWWLRSPTTNNAMNVHYITAEGRYAGYLARDKYGIRPAIILPSDMLVTDDMLAA